MYLHICILICTYMYIVYALYIVCPIYMYNFNITYSTSIETRLHS